MCKLGIPGEVTVNCVALEIHVLHMLASRLLADVANQLIVGCCDIRFYEFVLQQFSRSDACVSAQVC